MLFTLTTPESWRMASGAPKRPLRIPVLFLQHQQPISYSLN